MQQQQQQQQQQEQQQQEKQQEQEQEQQLLVIHLRCKDVVLRLSRDPRDIFRPGFRSTL